MVGHDLGLTVLDDLHLELLPVLELDRIRGEWAGGQKRQQQCQMYRDRLERFLRSQRLYQEDESGERQYLNEEETMAARARVEEQIQKYCGS